MSFETNLVQTTHNVQYHSHVIYSVTCCCRDVVFVVAYIQDIATNSCSYVKKTSFFHKDIKGHQDLKRKLLCVYIRLICFISLHACASTVQCARVSESVNEYAIDEDRVRVCSLDLWLLLLQFSYVHFQWNWVFHLKGFTSNLYIECSSLSVISTSMHSLKQHSALDSHENF